MDRRDPAVSDVGDEKKKGREKKVQKVTRRYSSAICGADTPRPIPIKMACVLNLMA